MKYRIFNLYEYAPNVLMSRRALGSLSKLNGAGTSLFSKSPITILFAFVIGCASCAEAQTDSLANELIDRATQLTPEFMKADAEEPLRRYKTQALQRAALSSGYLIDINDTSRHQWFTTEIGTGIPLGNFDNILATTISFRNDALAIPAEHFDRSDLYELSTSLFFKKQLSPRNNLLLNVQPGYLGDFEATSNTFGMFGMALVTTQLESYDITFSYGIVHLNQLKTGILPALGLRWEPEPEICIDLRFPESRISWRLDKNGRLSEHWLHASIGFDGNRWGTRKPDGSDEEIRLKYWAAALTLDKSVDGGGGWWIHLSHQFARRFLVNNETNLKLSNGFQLAAELAY